jgi:hypothetical protein
MLYREILKVSYFIGDEKLRAERVEPPNVQINFSNSQQNNRRPWWDIGPCPGESDDELETMEIYFVEPDVNNTDWDENEQFYQENQRSYHANHWDETNGIICDCEYPENHIEEEYQGDWSNYGSQSECKDLASGEIIYEEIQADLTSIVYGKYTRDEFNANFRAYTPTLKEFAELYLENLKTKNVVAGQPITKGGSRCTDACDIENHHSHLYCKACKKNLPYGTIVHDCTIGFEVGKIRPGMDPAYLVNVPWWMEPLAVRITNNTIHLKFLQKLLLNLPFYSDDHSPVIADLD